MASFTSWIIWIFLLKVISTSGKTSCPCLEKPSQISINEMMGKWYAVRGIEHSSTEKANNAKRTRSCPTITLTQKGDEIEFRWQSKDKPEKNFDLKINPNNPALWEHKNSKKGNNQDVPFCSLQVTKDSATSGVWGATMCKSGGRIASVILSRQPLFTEKDVEAITNKLTKQGLTSDNTYDRCIT